MRENAQESEGTEVKGLTKPAPLDEDTVRFSEMSDKEAAKFLKELNRQEQDLRNESREGRNPIKMMELLNFQNFAAKYRLNKYRSRHFKIQPNQASTRKQRRHPDKYDQDKQN